jgi:hypothetical protein
LSRVPESKKLLPDKWIAELERFSVDEHVSGPGPLSVVLFVTNRACTKGVFPISVADFTSGSGTQVSGLSGSAIRRILASHGIERRIASEGGRTSRGSLERAKRYIALLNRLVVEEPVDLIDVEAFWVARIRDFFDSEPLRISVDPAKSFAAFVGDVMQAAREREKRATGQKVLGVVMQHLVGAKLERLLDRRLDRHSASTADRQSARDGDFAVDRTVFHITSAPTSMLMDKCRANIASGRKPIIVTTENGLGGGKALADEAGIVDRIDIFEIRQFLALNLHEFANFDVGRREDVLTDFVARYNEIVEEAENNRSLTLVVG